MTGTFTAQIESFAAKSKAKIELVFKQSAQDVFEIAQRPVAKGGRMPVDTGFLRNSMIAAVNGKAVAGGLLGAPKNRDARIAAARAGLPDAYVLAIAGADLGDVVFGGWTAEYARHIEYGTSLMAGRHFALGAAQEWQRIVAANVEKAKAL